MTNWQLTIDANDPGKLLRFWGPLLGYEVTPPPAGFDTWRDYYISLGEPAELFTGDGSDRLRDPTGGGPAIWFQIVPERKSGTKNRLHLDIQVSDGEQPVEQRAEVVRKKADELCAGGASIVRRIEIDDAGYYFVVLHDPEGNEFCIS